MMEGEVMAEAVEAEIAQQVQKRPTKPHKITNIIAAPIELCNMIVHQNWIQRLFNLYVERNVK